MKKNYTWSFWTKPLGDDSEFLSFSCLCLIFSAFCVKDFSKRSVIYSDSLGKKILTKYLTDIEINSKLDSLDSLSPDLWAYCKMQNIEEWSEPVIHIDNDVFLLKEQADISGDIVCQHFEDGNIANPYWNYKMAYLDYLHDNGGEIDREILDLFEIKPNLGGYNCGFIEMNNLDFARDWSKRAKEMMLKTKTFSHHNNILAEQTLLYALEKSENKKINCLFSGELDDLDKNCEEAGYVHLMAAKYNRESRTNITRRFLYRIKEKDQSLYEKLVYDLDNNKIIL